MHWVVVDAFASELDANIAKGMLEAAGLQCRTRLNMRGDALLGTFGMRTGPTDLLIPEKDAEAAYELLSKKV